MTTMTVIGVLRKKAYVMQSIAWLPNKVQHQSLFFLFPQCVPLSPIVINDSPGKPGYFVRVKGGTQNEIFR